MGAGVEPFILPNAAESPVDRPADNSVLNREATESGSRDREMPGMEFPSPHGWGYGVSREVTVSPLVLRTNI
ncbi:hypothetical protein GCM10022421_18050 [Oceanisphaera sediminis]|uniref:Uncharacterized protein n=1 Tax=Oceanisphaera sediminis TaxID=981381 RepID=A0ABP7DZ66_9GAMM